MPWWIVPDQGIPEHSYLDHLSPWFRDPKIKHPWPICPDPGWQTNDGWSKQLLAETWVLRCSQASLTQSDKWTASSVPGRWPLQSLTYTQHNVSPPGSGHIVQGRIVRRTKNTWFMKPQTDYSVTRWCTVPAVYLGCRLPRGGYKEMSSIFADQ